MGVAESRITTIREICVIRSGNKEIYCNFADKNVTLSHISVKY